MGWLWLLLGSLALAGIVYLAVRLTVNLLKNYRKHKNSSIFVANVGEMIHNMPESEKHKKSFSDLEKMSDETIVGEYDPNTDETVQAHFVGDQGMDANIERAIHNNEGYIIIED